MSKEYIVIDVIRSVEEIVTHLGRILPKDIYLNVLVAEKLINEYSRNLAGIENTLLVYEEGLTKYLNWELSIVNIDEYVAKLQQLLYMNQESLAKMVGFNKFTINISTLGDSLRNKMILYKER